MFSFFPLLYRNHNEPWRQNQGTYRTVMFVYCYTPNNNNKTDKNTTRFIKLKKKM